MVAAFQEGYALDPSMVKTARRVTTASETTTYFGKRVFMKATYTIDTSKKTIDLLNTAGPKAGATQLGIYEVGGDMMKICFTGPGQERPSSFESKAGDGPTSAIWKRIKR